MSLLPFQQGDIVAWRGGSAYVREVRGERIVVEDEEGILEITTHERLRAAQPTRKGVA